MRIIGGKYRSRVLAEFEGKDIRPTSDRVKESVFNIISAKLPYATVLDLFCGSGALGIESISRGASFCCFNDISKESVKVLQSNLSKLGVEKSNYSVSVSDYTAFLSNTKQKFDIVFIDPPYRFDFGVPSLEIILKRNLLNENGIVIYERDRSFEGEVEGFEKYDERKYGKTFVTFFKLKEN